MLDCGAVRDEAVLIECEHVADDICCDEVKYQLN